ncbi:MAG: hypothetical protein H7Y22_19710 [Gemmatimonadaceae bacterium]|nr:hypothetical protein [Gloeobacterales cyanobacterium ES-bin-141]
MIGNSQDVPLSKALLEQRGFTNSAELSVEDGQLTLVPTAQVRADWLERFAQATDIEQAKDLDYPPAATTNIEWDEMEWYW